MFQPASTVGLCIAVIAAAVGLVVVTPELRPPGPKQPVQTAEDHHGNIAGFRLGVSSRQADDGHTVILRFLLDQLPADPPDISAEVWMAGHPMPPTPILLRGVETGHYELDLKLSMPGEWRLGVYVGPETLQVPLIADAESAILRH